MTIDFVILTIALTIVCVATTVLLPVLFYKFFLDTKSKPPEEPNLGDRMDHRFPEQSTNDNTQDEEVITLTVARKNQYLTPDEIRAYPLTSKLIVFMPGRTVGRYAIRVDDADVLRTVSKGTQEDIPIDACGERGEALYQVKSI